MIEPSLPPETRPPVVGLHPQSLAGTAMPQLPANEIAPLNHDLWKSLGVSDLEGALGPSLPLEKLARKHLELHPYTSRNISDSSLLWYEGSFDPIGIHHFKIFYDTLQLGFKHAVFAIVYQNPYKKDSLPYEHRYEMARAVMEKAGLTVVDEYTKEGVCIFPPGSDGLRRFHEGRMAAIYGDKNFILVGPDNFEKAMTHNIIWTHIPEIRNSPHAQSRYGFRSMYTDIEGFRDRVLVYPVLNSVHSTDIRKGASPMLAPVADYVKERGLYQSSPGSMAVSQPAPAPQAPTRVRRSSDIEAELELQSGLVKRLQNGLTGLPMSMQELRSNFQRVLGNADRSELQDLSNVLTKCEDRLISKPRGTGCFYLDKRRALSTALLNEISERLIGSHIEVQGIETLQEVTKDHTARIVFVCNESGWGEVPVLVHALELNRFGALAEASTFVFGRSQVFPSPTIAATVGHGVTCIHPVRGVDSPATEGFKDTFPPLIKAGLDRLSDGPVVLFPEQGAVKGEPFKLSTISPSILAGLRAHVEGDGDPDFDGERTYVVPVAIVGSDCIEGSVPFSGETPAQVSFGRPVSARALLALANDRGDDVVAHMLGFQIAGLMPEEWRGVYGKTVQAHRASGDLVAGGAQSPLEVARALVQADIGVD